MHSKPPARIVFLSPAAMAVEAIMTDFMPLAHILLSVVQGVSSLSPEPRQTCLAGAYPLPAAITLPRYTSSTSSGATCACARAPLVAIVPSWGPLKLERPPMNVPIGVRLTPTMTTFLLENARLALFTIVLIIILYYLISTTRISLFKLLYIY